MKILGDGARQGWAGPVGISETRPWLTDSTSRISSERNLPWIDCHGLAIISDGKHAATAGWLLTRPGLETPRQIPQR